MATEEQGENKRGTTLQTDQWRRRGRRHSRHQKRDTPAALGEAAVPLHPMQDHMDAEIHLELKGFSKYNAPLLKGFSVRSQEPTVS